MYIVPILATLLAVVLFAASRTVKKDVERLQAWMRKPAEDVVIRHSTQSTAKLARTAAS